MPRNEHHFLSASQIDTLLKDCFNLTDDDKTLAILVDVPDENLQDCQDWQFRRRFALHWQEQLTRLYGNKKNINIYYYPNVGANNADLPDRFFVYTGDIENLTAEKLQSSGKAEAVAHVLQNTQIAIAMTQLSATAPLKNARTQA
ncbi:MAG: hypothetical protein DWQ10_04450 [Calditrichaeota bacterium]|nr:MAG: hypothetical protein DWQ10_04450 [Calditrichota bacterium]